MKGWKQQRSSYTESAGLHPEGTSQAHSECRLGTTETARLSHTLSNPNTHMCAHTRLSIPIPACWTWPVRHGMSEYLSAGKTACPRCCCHVCQRGVREREGEGADNRQTDNTARLCVCDLLTACCKICSNKSPKRLCLSSVRHLT